MTTSFVIPSLMLPKAQSSYFLGERSVDGIQSLRAAHGARCRSRIKHTWPQVPQPVADDRVLPYQPRSLLPDLVLPPPTRPESSGFATQASRSEARRVGKQGESRVAGQHETEKGRWI